MTLQRILMDRLMTKLQSMGRKLALGFSLLVVSLGSCMVVDAVFRPKTEDEEPHERSH